MIGFAFKNTATATRNRIWQSAKAGTAATGNTIQLHQLYVMELN